MPWMSWRRCSVTSAEATANQVTGVYLYQEDEPEDVILAMALDILHEAGLSPEQKDEGILYLARQLAERI